ncbi:ARM repeat superfamily protein [Perilla frutescens var. frutescens]|nr:ARM repeat superfamily protein [Perilla frutescens var. frutescens]
MVAEDSYGDGDEASSAVKQTIMLLQSGDPSSAVQAAKDIRRLTKTSRRHRRHFSAAVTPLVDMLCGGSAHAKEAALAALLNLAVKDDVNKINIINGGALNPIITFLESDNVIVQEHATAALITLSASSHNKPIIGASGATPLLVHVLRCGGSSSRARSDAATALYNLSTHQENLTFILHAEPIPPLISLLKSCKKSSKTAAKCAAVIESLAAFEAGRSAVASEEGGILTVVEVVEGGSVRGREHAVGALLRMCESEPSKYREAILEEGVMPGLMEVSVEGSGASRSRAQTLLRLLRDAP